MKRKKKKKKKKQCQGDLAEARGLKSRPFKGSGNDYLTCETILQGSLPLLLSHLLIRSTYVPLIYYYLIFLLELNKSLVGPYAESCACVCLSMEVNHVVEQ